MTALEVEVLGVGAWSPTRPGWPAWRAMLPAVERTTRPAAMLLPAAERRRAPDGVSVAVEVAREALAMVVADGAAANLDALASVFTSAHGDLAIVDYLCSTVAHEPLLMSPTRFHHSVHNAAAGYWSIATRNRAATTSLAGGAYTFATGLFEAMVQAHAGPRPVLLVAFDTRGVGPLAEAAPNTELFGCALVIAPARAKSGSSRARLTATWTDGACDAPEPMADELKVLARSSPSAQATVLLEALAMRRTTTMVFPSGPQASLVVTCHPADVAKPSTRHHDRLSSQVVSVG